MMDGTFLLFDNYLTIQDACTKSIQGRNKVLAIGPPGCGKSFVIIWWIKEHLSETERFLILVPYRRLVIQMVELLRKVLVPISLYKVKLKESDFGAYEGPSPNFSNIGSKKIIVSTYEHGYNIKKRFGPTNIIVDEVHNLFYPQRGWQIEPFLDYDNILVLTGTLLGGEANELKRRMSLNPRKPECAIWNMKLLPNELKLSRKPVNLVKLRGDETMIDVTSKYAKKSQLDIDGKQNPEDGNGGLFFFCPTINLTIIRAYEYASKNNIPIINPIADNETCYISERGMISFRQSLDTLSSNNLLNYINEDSITEDGIVKSLLESSPHVYIDFSKHYIEKIRGLLSSDPNCKLIVFCTTTLCEGLNLKSVKAIAIENGIWDERRLTQIQGRVGRFEGGHVIYFNKIKWFPAEKTILDPFDMLKIDLRIDEKWNFEYTIYRRYKFKTEEEEIAYGNLLSFLAREKYSSAELWLSLNLGITDFLKYRDYVKMRVNKNSKDFAHNNKAFDGISESTREKYNQYFKPLLMVDLTQIVDLIKVPEDEENGEITAQDINENENQNK